MDQYVTAADIAKKCRVHKATVWRWAASGIIPKPFKLTKRTTVWREIDVQSALDKLQAEAAA